MGSFRALVERQRADPIATEFLSVASSAIRFRALRFIPLLPITIAPHHHENVRFRAARHLRYVRLGVKSVAAGGGHASFDFRCAYETGRKFKVLVSNTLCQQRTDAPQRDVRVIRSPHPRGRAAL